MRSVTEPTWANVLTDWIALATGAAGLAAIVWATVMRATRPLRDRLDEIHTLADGLRAERERVDDLSERIVNIERRVGTIERRVEDLYHLLLTIIDPRRLRRSPDVDGTPDDDEDQISA